MCGSVNILKDSIEIRAKPEMVFSFFRNLPGNYKKWHKDHVSCAYVRGKPMEQGAVVEATEYLHGKLHKLRMRLKRIIPNELIEYNVLFPESIICPKGSFLFEKKGNGCVFTATLSFRFGFLLSSIAGKQIEAIKIHMREEGENLKNIIEERKVAKKQITHHGPKVQGMSIPINPNYIWR